MPTVCSNYCVLHEVQYCVCFTADSPITTCRFEGHVTQYRIIRQKDGQMYVMGEVGG